MAAILLVTGAASAAAQSCESRIVRTPPPEMEGAYVRSVDIRTSDPVGLPIVGDLFAPLHATTRTTVVRRQLLVAAGDRADTARIAESLRELRAQRLYADVALEVRRCPGSDSVDLVFTTRDTWTMRPLVRFAPPGLLSAGIEDRNLFGTGSALQVTKDRTTRGKGGSLAYTDPWLFGTSTIAGIRISDLSGNHFLRALVRRHEISVFDPWRAEATMVRQSFSGSRGERIDGAILLAGGTVGHLTSRSERAAIVAYAGVEFDSAGVVITSSTGQVDSIVRRFVGIQGGIQRRAAMFDTATWFAPGRGFVDVPIGTEGDVSLTPGYDRARHGTRAAFDAWVGRIWQPRRGYLITGDAWASGFIGYIRTNQMTRSSLSVYKEAPRGFWGSRVLYEQLLNVDLDLRGLTLVTLASDPSFAAVPEEFRDARRSLIGSIERSVHLLVVGPRSMLDAGVFAAGSLRWDSPLNPHGRYGVSVVGLRLRVLATNGILSSTRVDLSYPVALGGGDIQRRPVASLTVAPLYDFSRLRDALRRR